jgi:hypothetical protein
MVKQFAGACRAGPQGLARWTCFFFDGDDVIDSLGPEHWDRMSAPKKGRVCLIAEAVFLALRRVPKQDRGPCLARLSFSRLLLVCPSCHNLNSKSHPTDLCNAHSSCTLLSSGFLPDYPESPTRTPASPATPPLPTSSPSLPQSHIAVSSLCLSTLALTIASLVRSLPALSRSTRVAVLVRVRVSPRVL